MNSVHHCTLHAITGLIVNRNYVSQFGTENLSSLNYLWVWAGQIYRIACQGYLNVDSYYHIGAR